MSANEVEGEGPTLDVRCPSVEHLQTLNILNQPCRERSYVLLETRRHPDSRVDL
jgi:hypothetical protein